MKTILLGSVIAAALMITSCLNEESTESLLDSMPAGHDFYLTFNPREADIEELLSILSDSLNSDDIRIREIEEILGFFPLEWSGWVDALALRPDNDIGLIMDRHGNDIGVFNLILPSENPAEVERFFTGISNRMEEFDSRLSFTESEGYTIVTISQSAEEHSLFALDSGIRNDEDYIKLRGSATIHDAALVLYAKPDGFLDMEGIGSILFTCTVDNSILRLALDISFEGDDVKTFTSMLAPSPNAGDISIPPDVTGMLRISLDMQNVKDFLYSQGIDREFEPGIEDFGFSSFEELIDSFSGDIYFGFNLTDDSHAGFLQLGIRNPEAIDRMLYFIYTTVAGFSDPGMTSFDLDGHRCYRVSGNPSMGIDSIEFGIIDEMVVISGDFTLEAIAGGISFSDYIRRNGLGIGNETSVLLTSEMEPFSVSRDLPMELRRAADHSGITRLAASVDVDSEIVRISAALEFSRRNPLQHILRAVVSAGGRY
jgi:hypothetical protein